MKARRDPRGRRKGQDRVTGPEAGLMNIGFVAVAAFCTLSLLIGFMWMAVASSSAQGNQNAADAAALAGAEAFDDAGALYFVAGFSSSAELRSMVLRPGACPALVRSASADYASRNGARLESCRMRSWGDVEVTTRMEVPIEGAADGRSSARANWSLEWDNCIVDPSFVAPVTGVGVTWMQCADDRFDLKYVSGRYFVQPWSQVKQAIDRQMRLTD